MLSLAESAAARLSQDLAALILSNRATRSAVQIERLLAVCRGNPCGRWTPAGCRPDFPAFLADAARTCGQWREGLGIRD